MDSENRDIAEALVAFVESLPSTITNEVLLFVMMYGLDKYSMDVESFIPTIRDALSKTSGMAKMGVTIRIIGALDYILYRSEMKGRDSLRIMLQYADRLSPEIVEQKKASHPPQESPHFSRLEKA